MYMQKCAVSLASHLQAEVADVFRPLRNYQRYRTSGRCKS